MSLEIKEVQHFREKQKFHEMQNFDRKEISVIKCGKKINMYDSIQAANVDTDIYEVAKKYNNGIVDVTTLEQFVGTNLTQLNEEFQEYNDLRSMLDKEIAANNMWNNLPVSVRSQFNNNKYEFLDNAENWLKDLNAKVAEQATLAEKANQVQTEQKNEQK